LLQWGSQVARLQKGWIDGMSQERIELRGHSAIELRRVDRVLSELTRPAPEEDFIAPATLEGLAGLGIGVDPNASRRDVIERLWGRKRALLRQMSAVGDWGPMQPVA
jgi:hypothetical protein